MAVFPISFKNYYGFGSKKTRVDTFHPITSSTCDGDSGHNLYKKTPSELEGQPGGWAPCFLFAQKLLGFVVVMVCWFCLLCILAWVLQQSKIWTEKALEMLAGSTQRSRKRSKGAGEQKPLVSSPLLQPRWTPTKKRCPLPSYRDAVTLSTLHTFHQVNAATKLCPSPSPPSLCSRPWGWSPAHSPIPNQ